MAEQNKTQMGDGADNYGQAAGQMAKAAKQLGQEAAKQAAAKGVEATANAATAAVQASVEGGKAAAEIAAGTAAGGPWGAILSAAWAMRHTLYKILIFICLCLLILIILIASLPTIVTNSIFGLDGSAVDPNTTLASSYENLSTVVSDIIDAGYDQSLAKVEKIITDGGYDYDLSMEALINHAQSSAGFDVAYILAAYSTSMNQQNTNEADMKAKLESYGGEMFPVTSQELTKEILIPVSYFTYREVSVTVVTKKVQTGTVNGVPQYRYETENRTYYLPDESKSSEVSVTVPNYEEVTVTVPVYSGPAIAGTKDETYYRKNGEVTLSPTKETVTYVECTIHPFDTSVVEKAFGLDLDAQFDASGRTYGEVITNMANALKMTLYGSLSSGLAVPLTDAELIAFLNKQNCNATRKHIVATGLSLVGKVPYFWGGKSPPGWNDEWNTPKLVTAAGSSTSGTIRPYGLDCSGFSDWVYKTAVGVSLYGSTWDQWGNSYEISASELLPGDLGFLMNDDDQGWNHVLVFAGYGDNGERMWVHSSGGEGVIFNSPSYESTLALRRPKDVDFNAPVSEDVYGEPIATIEVDVTHYCACSKCCGENASGITASGKQVEVGMVAMSSYYPFGTQIMINGTMYTVEDRGGSGIENDKSRVDIYVLDHQEALRLGRYTTTAQIYRMGR